MVCKQTGAKPSEKEQQARFDFMSFTELTPDGTVVQQVPLQDCT